MNSDAFRENKLSLTKEQGFKYLSYWSVDLNLGLQTFPFAEQLQIIISLKESNLTYVVRDRRGILRHSYRYSPVQLKNSSA